MFAVDSIDAAAGGRIWTVPEAEAFCREVSKNYENFTVGSRLFPQKLRQDLVNFYAFCRWSDDLGDEGEVCSEDGRRKARERLKVWEVDLLRCYDGIPRHPVFVALRKTIQKHSIPPEPLKNLISAFKQDQTKTNYETFEELLDYCRRSANPVGRVYLMFFGYEDDFLFTLSDKICTALQLTNFWQDVSRDLNKGRIYIPLEDMRRFQYSENDLKSRKYNRNFQQLMAFEIRRTRTMFKEGSTLEEALPLNMSFEVKLFRKGGEKILKKIESLDSNVFQRRPVITGFDKASIFLSTYISSRYGIGR